MAERTTRFRLRNSGIENPDIATFDEDRTGARTGSYNTENYQFARSARPDDVAEEPMPLFLSDYADEYQSQDFEQEGFEQEGFEQTWQRRRKVSIGSRIFASVLAAASIAVLFAALSADATRAVIANASASIAGVLPGQSAPAPNPATQLTANDRQLKDPARWASPAAGQTVASRGPSAAAAAPSRGELAVAYQSAVTSQAAAATPPTATPPVAAAPARRLDADELAGLMKRAKSLIAVGDIAPARLLLERAADAQEASAALLLAQTYDPAVLGKADERSIAPDPVMAQSWYQKAIRLGSADAQQRLSQLQN
jgi:hypothetical protein